MLTKRIAAIAAIVSAGMLASAALAAPSDQYSILANWQPAGAPPTQLELRQPNPNAPELEGTIAGDALQGFYAANSGQIVWVRSSASGPSQVYVGRYVEGQRQFRPRPPREINGTVFALNAAGGATSQQNAFAFRAWNPFVLQQFPLRRGRDPAPSPTPHQSPAGPWWVTANTAQSSMVIEITASGAVSGLLLGDPIVGHYSSGAGTLAFLRMSNNRPAQFYQGVSVRRPAGARPIEFDGTLVALRPDAGASADDIDFPFSAGNESQFLTIRSVANRLCLEIANAAPGNHGQLALARCSAGAKHQQFAFVNTAGAAVLVARHSGRCLDVPNSNPVPGSIVQQYFCHGRQNQQAWLQGFGVCPRGFNSCQAYMLNGQLCLTAVGPVAAPRIATGSNCFVRRPEIEFDGAVVP